MKFRMKFKIRDYLDLLSSSFAKQGTKIFVLCLAKDARRRWAWCWATLPRRIVSCLVITSIVLSSGWYLFFRPQIAEAAWWDQEWLYRKSIAVTNNTTTETNKYISVDIGATSDTTKFQIDCGDLRFTKLDGSLLDYYVYSGCGTANTVIHILFDTFDAGAQTLYYYYGNPSADNGFKTADFSTVATNYTVGSIGSEEKGAGPVLWLKFDEGQGTTAYDSSGQDNDGTITNAVWVDSGCKSGKCLSFDGSGDYVNAGALNLAGDTTISLWAKSALYTDASWNFLAGNWGAGGSNNYGLYWYDSYYGGTGFISGAGSGAYKTNTYTDNAWHHIVGIRDGSTDRLYVDGVQLVSGANGALSNTGDNWWIGGANNSNYYFTGLIDEVKIYPYARTAAQVKNDYNKGAAMRVGGDESWLTNGLVGYWKMDEASWNTTTGQVIDSSGAGNNGTSAGNATTAGGRFANGGTFDGTGDYVQKTSATSLELTGNRTISAWLKLSTAGLTNRYVLSDRSNATADNYAIIYGWVAGKYEFLASPGNYTGDDPRTALNTVVNDTSWHHIVFTYDGVNMVGYLDGVTNVVSRKTTTFIPNAANFNIGTDDGSSNFWTGLMDDVRIYNRALSANEVAKIYNWGPPPVAQWTMNEGSGATIYDTAGTADGTITGATWKNAASCKYGSCLSFPGGNGVSVVNHGHAASIENTIQSANSFSISGWVKFMGTGGLSTGGFFGKAVKNTSGVYGLWTDGRLKLTVYTTPSTTVETQSDSILVVGNWYHYVAVRDNGTNYLYINGIKQTDSDTTSYLDATNQNFYIGRLWDTSNTYDFPGFIDDVQIYNYALTAKQIAGLYDGGSVGHSNAPAGFWKFDEGYGMTAYDSSGQANNLTLSAESYTMSGKFGKAWDGDGAKWLSRADDSDFDFAATDDFTISTWFKSDSASNPSSGVEYLAEKKASSAGYGIYMDTGGDVIFGVDDYADSTWEPDDIVGDVGRDFYDNTWHHFVGVKTGTSRIEAYVDGVKIETKTGLTSTGTLANSALLYLGDSDGTNNGDEFNGDIDETKIFRFAMSLEDVLLEYNQGKALRVAGSSATVGVYCPPGFAGTCTAPVGEWKMDEGSGSTVYDTSAATSDGTITGATWKNAAQCKYGNCLSFDGNDYVTLDNIDFSGKNVSFFAWLNPVDITGSTYPHLVTERSITPVIEGIRFIYDYAGAGSSSDDLDVILNISDVRRDCYGYNVLLVEGGWNHLGFTYDGTNVKIYKSGSLINTCNWPGDLVTPNVDLYIGSDAVGGSSWYARGLIDDVKIYDYALTQEQISWLYDKGKPVGYWKFDGGQGATAKDSTTSNNTGTISGATWTTSGKYNSALSFDGTGDFVNLGSAKMGSASGGIAASAWVYVSSTDFDGTFKTILADNIGNPDTENGFFVILDDRGGGNPTNGINISLDTVGGWQVYGANASNIFTTTSAWYHIVAGYNPGTNSGFLYVNGVPQSLTVTGAGTGNYKPDTDENLYIGALNDGTYSFKGSIDEVKIYNYAPTAEQVKLDYNQGAALKFGP